MAEKICDLIPIPVLVTQEKEYFIDYLLMKIQESTFDKVFDEMMINFEKKIDSLPEVYKRTLFAMEILFGKSETKEKMEKALELLVRTRSKIPENIVKEWNMTFYGGMPVVIVWAAAIIGVIAGIVTIVQSCHDVI
jgi:ABC-type dipeptide/oligopeptide/nickel transport system ATPase component